MNPHDDHAHCEHQKLNWLCSHKAAAVALVAIGIYAVVEHWQHLIVALPYLLFLSCPLMHLFMHQRTWRTWHASP
jgi:hypothetical protein